MKFITACPKVCFLAGLSVWIMFSGCISVDLNALLFPRLEEVIVQPGEGFFPPRVVLIDISGVISETAPTGLSGPRCTPDSVRAVLNRIEEDRRVKAVILRIDSPGGSVSASDMIYHEICQFQERTGVPVLAMIMGMGCSGGYYIANAAQRIYAHPSSITGSIGVIAIFPKLNELGDKIGVSLDVVKSGELKDMGSPMRPMTSQEREVFSQMINDFYGQFLDVVVQSRERFPDRSRLLPLADGRIFTAHRAAAEGLIDDVGYLDQVIHAAMDAAEITRAEVVTYSYRPSEDATIYSPTEHAAGVHMPSVNLSLVPSIGIAEPGFHYLWLPGH